MTEQQGGIVIELLRQIAGRNSAVAFDDVCSISLDAAHAIEDCFAQHHPGGRTQRLAKIQCIVRDAIISASMPRSSGEGRVV